MKLSAITTFILLVVGVPVAFWLSGKRTFFKVIIDTLITMPLVLPPSVLGFYLLVTFSPENWFGRFLKHYLGLQLVFSFEGLVLASILYSLPFMISPVQAAIASLSGSLSEASFTMGKTRFQTFFHILIPNIRNSLITASILTFAHTLGEFGVVLMIGGNLPKKTQVASIAIYDAVERMDYANAGTYSLLLFAISFIIVISVKIVHKNTVKEILR